MLLTYIVAAFGGILVFGTEVPSGLVPQMLVAKERKRKLRRQQNTPCINEGKGDTLARSAVSLLHQQRKKKTSGDLESGWQPPAPDRDLGRLCA